MSIFYVENRSDDPESDFNKLPSRREMASAPQYWNWVGQILGNVVGGHAEATENRRIEALRRNAEAYERQRQPSLIAEIVSEAIDHIVEAVVPAPIRKAMWAKERAKIWLLEQLASGPKAATALTAAAKDAGISARTVERARKALGLKPRRSQGRVWWMLPDSESAKK
jgi:hypothetical protein